MKKYTKTHLWIENICDDTYHVGITEFASGQLNGITYVELPQVGKFYNENTVFGIVESVKSVSELEMPFDCVVSHVNESCADNIDADPEGSGYICEIKNPSYNPYLMSKEEYDGFVS